MGNSEAKKPVGRPIGAKPITESKHTLYRFLKEAPQFPSGALWHVPIIDALIQRIQRRSPSEARYVRKILHFIAISERLDQPYNRLMGYPAKLQFLIKAPVPKTQHIGKFIMLQRDFLILYLKEQKFPFTARSWIEQKSWLKTNENGIVGMLQVFPCFCAYNCSISDIDTPKPIITSAFSVRRLVCRALANLHGSTETGIGEYLKSPKKVLE